MKRVMLSTAIVMIAIAMGGSVFAGTLSPTVSVSGTVLEVCTGGTGGVLAFGNIDPSAAGPLSATPTEAYVKCTYGTDFSVAAASTNKGDPAASCAGAGITGRLKDAGTNTMDYAFTCTGSGTGDGFLGSGVALGLGASIASAEYGDAPAGSYSDNVTLTITY
jgi:spore coat protein U-like protein